jgi:hypothetical protein
VVGLGGDSCALGAQRGSLVGEVLPATLGVTALGGGFVPIGGEHADGGPRERRRIGGQRLDDGGEVGVGGHVPGARVHASGLGPGGDSRRQRRPGRVDRLRRGSAAAKRRSQVLFRLGLAAAGGRQGVLGAARPVDRLLDTPELGGALAAGRVEAAAQVVGVEAGQVDTVGIGQVGHGAHALAGADPGGDRCGGQRVGALGQHPGGRFRILGGALVLVGGAVGVLLGLGEPVLGRLRRHLARGDQGGQVVEGEDRPVLGRLLQAAQVPGGVTLLDPRRLLSLLQLEHERGRGTAIVLGLLVLAPGGERHPLGGDQAERAGARLGTQVVAVPRQRLIDRGDRGPQLLQPCPDAVQVLERGRDRLDHLVGERAERLRQRRRQPVQVELLGQVRTAQHQH